MTFNIVYGEFTSQGYFEERARGGVGLIVTGGIAPNRAGRVSPLASKLTNSFGMFYSDAQIMITQRIKNLVHRGITPQRSYGCCSPTRWQNSDADFAFWQVGTVNILDRSQIITP